MSHPLRFESKKGQICVAWVWNREGTEKLVNGKQHSVWFVPTGMKGLPQNVLLNFRLEFPKSDLTIYLPSGLSEIFRQMVSPPQVRTRRHSKGYCVKLRIGVWTNQSENFLPTANDRKAGFWTNQIVALTSIPPMSKPWAFDTFPVPWRREFVYQSLPVGGEFDPHALGVKISFPGLIFA